MSCEPQTISPRRAKRPAGKAVSTPTPESRPDPQPLPPAPQPAPTVEPPARRRLPGWVHGMGVAECLHSSVIQIRAEYDTGYDAVRLSFWLENYNRIVLIADYDHVRAAASTLGAALKEFSRFHQYPTAEARFPHSAQVTCYYYTCLPPAVGADEALCFKFLPGRCLIQLHGQFSDEDSNGKRYSVTVYLTRTEAEAMLFDLDRSVTDYELYGGAI